MNDYYGGGGYFGDGGGGGVSRLQQQYWATKQTLLKKIGRKEDECIVASDAELDAKLELFQSIQHSCTTLLRVLEAYQDRLLVLSQEENALGRFLKECGKQDKTRAGKMMQATGKTLSFSAQQRLTLRVPLVRLYQEVETYESRAVADTQMTVSKMEKCRTDYRGGLLWMKDISQQLDPDTHRQMEKFRKVQGHVKRCKTKFDRLKVDTLQKVDLLAASRCNMFSHVLAAYQSALLQFWDKTSSTMTQVSESFKGYQHFDFVVIKELAEPSRRLAEETSDKAGGGSGRSSSVGDKDKDTFFNSEYSDASPPPRSAKRSSESLLSPGTPLNEDDVPLLLAVPSGQREDAPASRQQPQSESSKLIDDLLSTGNEDESGDSNKQKDDDMQLLREILDGPQVPAEGSFTAEWQSAFGVTTTPLGGDSLLPLGGVASAPMSVPPAIPPPPGHTTYMLPSQLLDFNAAQSQMQQLSLGGPPQPLNFSLGQQQIRPPSTFMSSSLLRGPSASGSSIPIDGPQQPPLKPSQSLATSKKGAQQSSGDMSAWFNLFADLDPLSNPDAIGKKADEQDRSC